MRTSWLLRLRVGTVDREIKLAEVFSKAAVHHLDL